MFKNDPRLGKHPLPEKGILEVLIEEKLITVEEIAQITLRSESTVRRWVRRETWPDVIDVQNLITGVTNDECRRRMVARLFADVPVAITWRAEHVEPTEHQDLSDHASTVVYEVARLLQRARQIDLAGGQASDQDRDTIEEITSHAIDELVALRELASKLMKRRRSARPLPNATSDG
ncbi:MAG: hypothetical protein AAF078_03445 [Planctomycetota bacterium]